MSQSSAKLQEPSMEEILASIRRIISDETAASDEARAAPRALREVKAQPAPAEPPAVLVAPVAVEPARDISQEAVDEILSSADGMSRLSGQEPGVLELTEAVEAPAVAAVRAMEAADVVFREPDAPAFAASPPERQEEPTHAPQPQPASDADALMSAQTTAAVSAAFDSLTNTFFARNARTIEDLVREMLRPMLKHWLDDNLPSLVERMVRAEIERVSRGGR
jgi:cell pole-organizing protein PopZ